MGWANREEQEWMGALIPEFKEAQKNKTTGEFWAKRTADFLKEWPNRDAELRQAPGGSDGQQQASGSNEQTSEQANREGKGSADSPVGPNTNTPPKKAKKGRLHRRVEEEVVETFASEEEFRKTRATQFHDWIYNAIRKPRCAVNLQVVVRKKDEYVLTHKQIYSKQYYPNEVKPAVEAEMAMVADPAQRLAVYHRHLDEAWENASEDIKRRIAEDRAKLVQKKRSDEERVTDILKGDINDPVTLEDRALVQASLEDIADNFLQLLRAKTGWTFELKWGGPQSALPNAPVQTYAYDVRALSNKQTFMDWHPMFKESCSTPFAGFCHKLFPEEHRLRQAIEIDVTKVKDPAALEASGRAPGRLRWRDDVSGAPAPGGAGQSNANENTPDLSSSFKITGPPKAVETKRKRGRPPKKTTVKTPSDRPEQTAAVNQLTPVMQLIPQIQPTPQTNVIQPTLGTRPASPPRSPSSRDSKSD